MFRRTGTTDCTIRWNGVEIAAREGEFLAAVLLAAGILYFRDTAVSGSPRGPLCRTGACFDGLVEVAGEPAAGGGLAGRAGAEPAQGVSARGDGAMPGPRVRPCGACARGVDPADLLPLRTRFPVKPITVGELAVLK